MKATARLGFWYRGREIKKGQRITLSTEEYADLKDSGLIRDIDPDGKGIIRSVPRGMGLAR
jgi:hypothetical protein